MPAQNTPSRISIYPNIKQKTTKQTITIDKFLEDIRSGTWQDFAIQIRLIKDKEGQKEAKKKIPYVTISGLFTGERNKESCSAHSGFLSIDLDNLFEETEDIKDILANDPYVYACFTSVSGTGLCALFKIKGGKHEESFDAIANYLLNEYRIVADTSGRDVSRARFVSFDPSAFIREGKTLVWRKYLPSIKRKLPSVIVIDSEFTRILSEMVQRRIGCMEDYRDWISIGFALADHFGENGRAYFHQLSELSAKYDPAICDKQYDISLSRDKKDGNKITIGTLYWHAHKAGIRIQSNNLKDFIAAVSDLKSEGLSKGEIAEKLKQEGLGSDELMDQAFDLESGEVNIVASVKRHLRLNYELKKNLITYKFENNGAPLDDTGLNSIYLNCKIRFDKLNFDLFYRIVDSDNTPTYNPIHDWFSKHSDIRPTGVIESYFKAFKTDGDIFYFGTKWLVSAVASAYGTHSPLSLILAGETQGTGKTEAFRRLLPKELRGYYAEIAQGTQEKDFNIMLSKKWIVMDDECGNKNKKEAMHRKALLSTQGFNVRRPHGKLDEDINRLAVLCGTSNHLDLLDDPTGNRRDIVMEIEAIDFEILDNIDRTELWMEAYHLFNNGFNWRIAGADVARLAGKSEKFNAVSMENEIIAKNFRPSAKNYMTATQIKSRAELLTGQKISLKRLGQELSKAGYARHSRWVNKYSVLKVYQIEEFNQNFDDDLDGL